MLFALAVSTMEYRLALAIAPLTVSLNNQPFLLWSYMHNRKSWLFCWTELGAQHVGIIQSLIVTCRLQTIDPYTYLVDVLQRVGTHSASRAAELTPRLWKQQFVASPLRSDIHNFRH